MNPDLGTTILYMKNAHKEQFDKGGRPYFLHPLRVMTRLQKPTVAQRHAALLHDVVEDTFLTIHVLERYGYDQDVLNIVDLLSRNLKIQSHAEYMKRIIDSGHRDVMEVKLADVYDNMSPSRIAQLPESEFGLERRYQRDAAMLEKAIRVWDWTPPGQVIRVTKGDL